MSRPPDAPSSRFLPWRKLWSWAPLLSMALLVACSGGGGCSSCGGAGLAPIKGGFPVDKRKENAVQLRLAKGMFDFLSANAKNLINLVLPNGEIPVPSTCTGDAQICCGQMCKIKADFTSLSFSPKPPNTTGFVVRTKLRTLQDMNLKYKSGIINVNCQLQVDSARSGKQDIGITASLVAAVDGQTKLTNLDIDDNSVDILDLDNGDIVIKGGLGCDLINIFKGLFIGTLKDQIKKQLAGPLDSAFCQQCKTKDDCSSFATQGCMNSRCMRNNKCMQLLGVEGALDVGGLLPAAKGSSMNIYAVAGGYATVEAVGGMSLGMLGGVETASRAACVPERPQPQVAAPPRSAALAGNNTPNGKPFHLGAGVSTMELDLFGHGLYQSGGLCLSLGTPDVALLSTGTLTTLVRSLEDLTRGSPASVYIIMRPQQAPTFALGKGTYKTVDGKKVIDDPLLKINMKDFALDFYLYMDERYTRFMRLQADVDVPLGLDVDNMNQLVPILGDLGQALGNIRVSETALLKESPAQLAALFPKLLPILLGQVAGSLKPIALPDIMGYKIKPVQMTSLDGQPGKLELLGLFFELGVGAMGAWNPEVSTALSSTPGAPVDTTADLVALTLPTADQFALGPKHDPSKGAKVTLRVDARGSGSLEWQYSLDGGLWRPFSDQHELTLSDPELGLAGPHYVDVRARVVGEPETLDPTPARVFFNVAPTLDLSTGQSSSFHGRTTETGGCSGCATTRSSGPTPATVLLFSVLFGSVLALRRKRGLSALPFVVGLAGVSSTTGCAGTPEGTPATPGETFREDDEIGRYQSAVAKGKLIFISAYNSTWGDLAYAEVAKPEDKIVWRVVDGLPEGPPTDDMAGAPRKGHTEPGQDVGRFTSIALSSKNVPVIAYQDATASAVKLAIGPASEWKLRVIDAPKGSEKMGMFTQLSLDENDVPSVAYMVTGIRKEGGKIASQLVVATAGSANPADPGEWTRKVVEEVETPCAGLCQKGEACVAVGMAKDPQPSVCKPVVAGCMPGCGMGQACVENKCTAVLAAGPADIPEGTGLYVKLLRGPNGLQVVFHNRVTGALKMAAAPEWQVKAIHGGDGKVDVGQHLGAAIGEDGSTHIAYVDAVTDQLLFRSVKGDMIGMTEMVDDGVRGSGQGREQHAVGAGALVFIDGGTPRVVYQDQTSGTLELASRNAGWMRETKGMGGTRSRGFYPQAVVYDGKWLLLDVVYDRARETSLSAVEFSPL